MNTTDKSKEAKMKRFEEEEDKGKPICSLSNFSTVAVSKSMKSYLCYNSYRSYCLFL